MIIKKVLTHKRYAENKIKDVDNWKIDDSDKKDVKQFIEDYKSGEITGRIGTNIEATVERVLQLLRISLESLSKNKKNTIGKFTKKNEEDIKKFKEAILKDKLKNKYKKPFAIKGKKMLFITLRQYLKWKLEPDVAAVLIKPLNIRIESKKPEPKFLTISEIDKLYKNCKNNKQRFIIAVLFGSGTRAEEFLNTRYSDYVLPDKNETFVKLRIREGFSKTGGRTISLYYDKCLEAVRDYLKERQNEGIEPDEPVLKDNYENMLAWLSNFGNKTLKKRVHFHLFRSSCATWLANRFNRQQMCYYFAWKFNSSMPDTYISRKGLIMEDVDDKFERTELEELKTKLEKENQEKNFDIEELKKDKIKITADFKTFKKELMDKFEQVVQTKGKLKH